MVKQTAYEYDATKPISHSITFSAWDVCNILIAEARRRGFDLPDQDEAVGLAYTERSATQYTARGPADLLTAGNGVLTWRDPSRVECKP